MEIIGIILLIFLACIILPIIGVCAKVFGFIFGTLFAAFEEFALSGCGCLLVIGFFIFLIMACIAI